ncbi:cupin domain-containing protein [Thiomicrorhabdus aquaedulcis]|uniref:cupin domain-containing protein n=1 Tax=Thiomicrorhabdus aquaedulcis TaxID=2211106 RepID=UPI000FD89A7B|nr:cupin domain-containing protein [Thiomicrorhabdus aquaedulcis]
MDFTQRVWVDTHAMEWQGSRADGVLRKPLEREFTEHGRTTSIVQFMPGAAFPKHTHPLGEEILVLDGVFSDERGDYPAGTYLRNPPNSSHAPFSKEGCVLFVKLDQFDPLDLDTVVLPTHQMPMQPGLGGLKVLPLHHYGTESCALVFWPKGERFQAHKHWGGEEILVLSGTFKDEHGAYPTGSWLRSPHLSEHFPYADEETLIYVKTGHL